MARPAAAAGQRRRLRRRQRRGPRRPGRARRADQNRERQPAAQQPARRALLADSDHEVVAAVGNADDLLAAVDEHHPDAAVVDAGMPPGYTDEGLRAASAIRRDHPRTGVLVFSPYIETRYTAELLGAASGGGAAGVGYLLKDRVADVEKSVEKHVGSIFSKLGLAPSHADHRRVLAVLRDLES
jgi:CheY-like chemotaxis protein